MKYKHLIIIGLFFTGVSCKQYTSNKRSNDIDINMTEYKNKDTLIETATLAGGCFWCVETTLNRLKGIDTVISGYTGGLTKNPTYKEICTGLTGHAEAVQVYYNPAIISYETILTVFFTIHDPTTLNRQGGDIGTQYRSAIFYNNENQKMSAEIFIKELEKNQVFDNKIVTEINPLTIFYEAEDYHQNYYNLNREQNSYCTAVIDPKVSKLRKSFSHLLKD
ncbi:MAG: peptide-methionine (S)-S-oxide reductase MsrA [Bacteroidota bacterium]|nr:peptide-methionine (S)-S-oxide reductase MsrA [Bacteroidota bacterium]